MLLPAAAVLFPPPPDAAWLFASLALAAAACFATLREALLRSISARVLARVGEGEQRGRLERLLARAEPLATSAGLCASACALAFVALLLLQLSGGRPLTELRGLGLLASALLGLVLALELVPGALARRFGDGLLARGLPAFHLLQLPLVPLVLMLEAGRRALERVLGLREYGGDSREIVEGLREVLEDSERSGGLDPTERELLENVIEFRDVDVAAIMTPRTEVYGVEVHDDLVDAARAASECGHNRLPVYEDSLDRVLGIVHARDLLQVAAERGLRAEPRAPLREILRPAYFVPETKRVSELLAEFRREKIKIAIVLDEYGGTAGLVSLSDITAEIVGEVPDEFDGEEPAAFITLEEGAAEVDAAAHVSEVNEALALDLPDGQDYETLGGYVLAELGRFPKAGEGFERDGVRFTVVDASDRRVLRVRVQRIESAAVPARRG